MAPLMEKCVNIGDNLTDVQQLPMSFKLEPAPPSASGRPKRSLPEAEPSRLKKLKLSHTYIRSPLVLQPKTNAPQNHTTSDTPDVFKSSTAMLGKRSRMAPSESVWRGDANCWLFAVSLQEMYDHQCLNLDLKEETAPCTCLRPPVCETVSRLQVAMPRLSRTRSFSAPPRLDQVSGSDGQDREDVDYAKAQMLALIRSRISLANGSKKSALHLRKWVIWNSWTRRPPTFQLPLQVHRATTLSPSDLHYNYGHSNSLFGTPFNNTNINEPSTPSQGAHIQTLEDLLVSQSQSDQDEEHLRQQQSSKHEATRQRPRPFISRAISYPPSKYDQVGTSRTLRVPEKPTPARVQPTRRVRTKQHLDPSLATHLETRDTHRPSKSKKQPGARNALSASRRRPKTCSDSPILCRN